jgi:hypothetical protein
VIKKTDPLIGYIHIKKPVPQADSKAVEDFRKAGYDIADLSNLWMEDGGRKAAFSEFLWEGEAQHWRGAARFEGGDSNVYHNIVCRGPKHTEDANVAEVSEEELLCQQEKGIKKTVSRKTAVKGGARKKSTPLTAGPKLKKAKTAKAPANKKASVSRAKSAKMKNATKGEGESEEEVALTNIKSKKTNNGVFVELPTEATVGNLDCYRVSFAYD